MGKTAGKMWGAGKKEEGGALLWPFWWAKWVTVAALQPVTIRQDEVAAPDVRDLELVDSTAMRLPNKLSKSKSLKIYLYNCVDRFFENLSTKFAYIVRSFSWKYTILILSILCTIGYRKSIDFWLTQIDYIVNFLENS